MDLVLTRTLPSQNDCLARAVRGNGLRERESRRRECGCWRGLECARQRSRVSGFGRVSIGTRLTSKPDSMTGANMNLVTVNVKLGENDPDPEQHLEPVTHMT